MPHTNHHISLPEVAITEWLHEIGDSAFAAWLRLRIWRDQNQLSIPLRDIIQKLGVANATFYNKILNPLLEHGLVQTHCPAEDKRKIYLHVYDTPHSFSEKKSQSTHANKSCDSLSSFETSSNSATNQALEILSPNEKLPHTNAAKIETISKTENKLSPTVAKNETFQIQERSSLYVFNPNLLKEKERKEKETKDPKDQIDLHSLPLEIQREIEFNALLRSQTSEIAVLYHKFKTYPHFSLSVFIDKMNVSMEKVKNVSAFRSYFQKTLQNLWGITNQPDTISSRRPASNLPPWVQKQIENPDHPEEPCSPEQQAILNDLLEQVNALGK